MIEPGRAVGRKYEEGATKPRWPRTGRAEAAEGVAEAVVTAGTVDSPASTSDIEKHFPRVEEAALRNAWSSSRVRFG